MARVTTAAFFAIILASASELSARQQAPSPPGPAATAGSGLIFGRVVDVDTGTTISGVVVAALATADPLTTPPSGPPQAMVTDSQGRFVFRNLPKGTYTLTASVGGNGYSPSGFIVTGFGHQIGAYLNGGYGQRRPNGPLLPIELADGERIGDVVIPLWRGGAISGRVFDEAGEPLVDVAVAAVRRSSEGRLLTGPTTRTDDRGMYRLGTLTPGNYLIVVPQTQVLMPLSTIESLLSSPPDPTTRARFADSGAPQPPHAGPSASPSTETGVRVGSSIIATSMQGRVTNLLAPSRRADGLYVYQTTFFPSAVTASRAAAIAIRSGQQRPDVDVSLQPVRAVEVSGTLVDSTGPVPNFGVHLMPADAGDGASVLEVATIATDARGAFVFPLVPSGSYTLLAHRSAAAGAAAAAEPRTVSEMPGAWAAQPLTVGDVNVTDVALMLRPGVQVIGRVAFHGTSEQPPGGGLRQMPVTLTRAQPLFRNDMRPSATPIDATGGFTARGIAPGRYVLGARDAGQTWTLQSVTVGGRDITDAVITIGDADIADVVVTFTDQPAHLSGTVSGAKSATDVDATVFVFPTNRARWPDARASTRVFRTVRADKSGAFKVSNIIPGEYFAVAAPDGVAGDWPDERLLAKLAPLAGTIVVNASQRQIVNLRTVIVR